MNNTLKVKLKSRVDTSENWTKINPVLLSGEQGIELTPDGAYYIKIGDGKTTWTKLPYARTDLSTKSVQDSDGNVIVDTYVKKNEIPTIPDMSDYIKDSELPILTDDEINASFEAADATIEELTNTHGVYVGATEPDINKYTLWIDTE